MITDATKSLVPNHIQQLQPYVPGKTIAEIKERYNPPRIAKLGSNENQLGCSPQALEAARNSLQNISSYPDPISRNLRHSLAGKLKVNPDNIILGNGSNGIIQYMVKAFMGEGDQALTATGTFVGFFVAATINNIPIERIDLTDDYRYNLEAMADAVRPETKMIYIANPNNPTGTYVTKSEFEVFMKRIPKDILVVVDEAYFEYAILNDNYPRALDYTHSHPNLIVLRTFSKAYGLAGLRIGYAVARKEIIKVLNKVKPTFAPSVPAQAAALAAIEDQDFIAKSVEVVRKGREQLYQLFDEFQIAYVTSSSNSVMMICNSAEEAQSFNEAMVKKGVIIRPLPGFGLPNAIRITMGDKLDMDHFEKCFREVMQAKN